MVQQQAHRVWPWGPGSGPSSATHSPETLPSGLNFPKIEQRDGPGDGQTFMMSLLLPGSGKEVPRTKGPGSEPPTPPTKGRGLCPLAWPLSTARPALPTFHPRSRDLGPRSPASDLRVFHLGSQSQSLRKQGSEIGREKLWDWDL